MQLLYAYSRSSLVRLPIVEGRAVIWLPAYQYSEEAI